MLPRVGPFVLREVDLAMAYASMTMAAVAEPLHRCCLQPETITTSLQENYVQALEPTFAGTYTPRVGMLTGTPA